MKIASYREFAFWDKNKQKEYLDEIEKDYMLICKDALCSSKAEVRDEGEKDLYRLKFFLNDCYRGELKEFQKRAVEILKQIKVIEEGRKETRSAIAKTIKKDSNPLKGFFSKF